MSGWLSIRRGFVVRRLKLLVIAVLAVSAVGVMAASSASALLPTVLFLSGTTSVLLLGSHTGAETAVLRTKEVVIHAGKVAVELTVLTANTRLGSILLILLESGVTGLGEACMQTGQAAGTIHVSGQWHLVYGASALGANLRVVFLILFPKTTFRCGEEASLTLEGSQVQKLENVLITSESEEIGLVSKCEGTEKLMPELSRYENETGAEIAASLFKVLAGIKEKACLELSSELVLKSSKAGQMLQIDL